MRAALRERLRVGRCGPVSRRLARLVTRVAPVRRVDWIAYAIIGRPRRVGVTVSAERYGAQFCLDLASVADRLLYLDTYQRLAVRDVSALLRPDDLVVDVGANIGLYSLVAAARGSRAVAFEPVPATADRFEENLKMNPGFAHRVTLHRVGVSSAPGSLTLHTRSFQEYSGHASAHLPEMDGAESVQVRTTSLDLATTDLEAPVRLLKIDVEGHEAAVLKGGMEFFERLRPEYLFVELEEDHLRTAGSSGREVFDRIIELGYRALGGYTLHHGLWPLTSPSQALPPFPPGYGEAVLFEGRVKGKRLVS